MKICILGNNSLAWELAEILVIEGNEVFLIHSTEKPDFPKISHRRLYEYVWSYDQDFKLKERSWTEIDVCVALTDNDEKNILQGNILKKRGIQQLVVSLENYETYCEIVEKQHSFQIDICMNEAATMANTVNKFIEEDGAIPGETFWNGEVEICRHTIYYDQGLTDTALKDTDELKDLIAISIYRKNEFFVPQGSTILRNGDKLYLMGRKKDILRFKTKFRDGGEDRDRKKLWILSNGKRGEELAKALIAKGYSIKLTIDQKERLKDLRIKLSDAFVDTGTLTSLSLYQDEEDTFHGVICATDNDENNIIMGLLAHHAGGHQIMTVISNADYDEMTEGLPISLPLRPRLGILNDILRKIRGKGRISVHQVLGGNTEVLEMTLQKDSPGIGFSLKNLKLPYGVIIGSLQRKDGKIIIPDGETILEEDDCLIIFCSSEKRKELIDLLYREQPLGFFTDVFNLY
ncbi:MAG: TrkA C-terminal domain-containing protein [Tissierellia bacterium]|nr:TrkA C-terminal domain-containing protein [Tissierellia bacterium]